MTRLARNKLRLWKSLVRRQAHRFSNRKTKKPFSRGIVPVVIVNAVNGERAKACVINTSKRKFQIWLSYKNERARVEEVVLQSSQCFFFMDDADWKDFPIILEVGTIKTPYLVDHTSPKVTTAKKTTVTLFLRLADNMEYLSAIQNKRKNIAQILPNLKKRYIPKVGGKAKRRKR